MEGPSVLRCSHRVSTSGMSDTFGKGNSTILQLIIAIVNKQGETYTSKP